MKSNRFKRLVLILAETLVDKESASNVNRELGGMGATMQSRVGKRCYVSNISSLVVGISRIGGDEYCTPGFYSPRQSLTRVYTFLPPGEA